MLAAPQTANRYSYGLNNPFRYTDPSGHFIQTAIDHPGEIVSLAISFTVLPGLVAAGIGAISGVDPFTGRVLSPEERTFAAVLLGAVPLAKALDRGRDP